ncbi:MAG TPA: hypothetical protein VMC42_01985 [Methanoregulaceae archaeon]|nr:hypothetical protein [Methanoregulaceae archaeon]
MKELPAAITVCDRSGNVIEMNEASAANYKTSGGYDLIGTNIKDCHPAKARDVLDAMFANGTPYMYTIEKNGIRKLICELPWYDEAEFSGFVEFTVVLPEVIPNYLRD